MGQNYYEAGKCNINDAEMAYKRVLGIIFALIAVVLAGALYVFRMPAVYGFTVMIPLWLAIMQYLQVKNRFCATYGIKGLHLSGAGRGRSYLVRITENENRRLDKAKSKTLIFQALIIAIIIAFAFSTSLIIW